MRQTLRSTKPQSEKNVKRQWHLVNVEAQILGRTANSIAKMLQGKHKVTYTPNIDAGDYVVVINAKKVDITGRKADMKIYSYYSGYPGGLKKTNFKELMKKNPTEIIRHAVSGMLPKNKLRDRRLARLFIFGDENHSYQDKFTKNK